MEPIKTLRDEFAMAALAELVDGHQEQPHPRTIQVMCNRAYLYADAMMQARSSSTPSETPTTNSSQ